MTTVIDPVVDAVARVLGLPEAGRDMLRHDSPLTGLGFDSLALLCVADALAATGLVLDEDRARLAITVGELTSCVAPELVTVEAERGRS
mgnify:CR=1 FL=1